MNDALAPGATIGILGGGQLGRMLAVAASRLGLHVHIFDPGADPPAGEVAGRTTTAAYGDEAALVAFAEDCDVITYEFENVPTAALDLLEDRRPIRPGREALRISQDRLTEKNWLVDLGLAVAPFAQIRDAAGLADALERIGRPAILKTRRYGYDGKGQVWIDHEIDCHEAFASLKDAPAIVEGVVPFEREISVIGSRGLDGRIACFDPGENRHEEGILRETRVPAGLPQSSVADAVLITGRILAALDYVGVIGVELFVTDGGLVVNEIAPRVHNSGHWTQNGCLIDQFEQHVRAVAGWPIGDAARHTDIVMENLIGDDLDRLPELAAEPTSALHLYGKAEVRPGRKMGHVNRRR